MQPPLKPAHKQRLAYAGVGSRDTPADIQDKMAIVASILEEKGFLLRSGAADGADKAFEYGVKNRLNKEIYLPWGGFNGSKSVLSRSLPAAFEIAEHHIAHWDRMSQGSQRLHARNVHQVMGRFLDDPVKFLLCWTKGGQVIGGTATAIKIANSLDIPVLNMGALSLSDFSNQLWDLIERNLK